MPLALTEINISPENTLNNLEQIYTIIQNELKLNSTSITESISKLNGPTKKYLSLLSFEPEIISSENKFKLCQIKSNIQKIRRYRPSNNLHENNINNHTKRLNQIISDKALLMEFHQYLQSEYYSSFELNTKDYPLLSKLFNNDSSTSFKRICFTYIYYTLT